MEQALPGQDGYEKGYKDALERIVLALGQNVSWPALNKAITTTLDAYANNAEQETPSSYERQMN